MKSFYLQVYELVAKIPPGNVATYGQIASLLGNPRGSRAVGWAMRAAPSFLNLPCHRVVNATGGLAPPYVFGGEQNQQEALAREGITFKADGRIDIEQHLWEANL